MYKKSHNQDLNINHKKGMPSPDHWEVHLPMSQNGANDAYGAFMPKPGKDRPTMYEKTNECDN